MSLQDNFDPDPVICKKSPDSGTHIRGGDGDVMKMQSQTGCPLTTEDCKQPARMEVIKTEKAKGKARSAKTSLYIVKEHNTACAQL